MSLDEKLHGMLRSFPMFSWARQRQWAGEEAVIDLQIGRTCWYSVERKMRTELWLSVLHSNRLKIATDSYRSILIRGQQLPEQVALDIEKDVNRTFPEVAKFAKGDGAQSLMHILKAYAAWDEEIGYCQGMNFLVGMLLVYIPQEEDAFGALVLLMQHRHLRDLYKTDLAALQVKLWQVGRLMPSGLAAHLEEHSCLPVLYMSAWFLTGYASSFPLPFASRIMDVLLTDSYREPMMKVSLAILKTYAPQLMKMDDLEELVEFLKDEVPLKDPERLQEILTEALSTPWSAAEVAILEDTASSVSVIEAVKANDADVLSGAAAARSSLVPLATAAAAVHAHVTEPDELQQKAPQGPPLWSAPLPPQKDGLFGGGTGAPTMSGLLLPPPRSAHRSSTGTPSSPPQQEPQQKQQQQQQQGCKDDQHMPRVSNCDSASKPSAKTDAAGPNHIHSHNRSHSLRVSDGRGGGHLWSDSTRPGVLPKRRHTAADRPGDLLSGNAAELPGHAHGERRASSDQPAPQQARHGHMNSISTGWESFERGGEHDWGSFTKTSPGPEGHSSTLDKDKRTLQASESRFDYEEHARCPPDVAAASVPNSTSSTLRALLPDDTAGISEKPAGIIMIGDDGCNRSGTGGLAMEFAATDRLFLSNDCDRPIESTRPLSVPLPRSKPLDAAVFGGSPDSSLPDLGLLQLASKRTRLPRPVDMTS